MSDEQAPTASGMSWYVVHAKPHREAVADQHLRRKGFDVFYPKLELPVYAAAPRRWVPLFPGYLFTRVDLVAHSHEVAWTPGVKQLVGTGGVPTPVDADIVEFLKRHAAADGSLPARPDLRRGQAVQIIDGPFAGLLAIIEHPPDAQGRIRVLMRLLNRRPVAVRMSLRFVKSAWVA